MKIIGLIAEYNPFHLGHLYQINKIKEMYDDSLIIAIISTNFTQRGDISILNKWDKTKICLNHNIDLVIELPTIYATQSADMFAYGAISILNKFKIDTLVFGSETDDIKIFTNLAKIQLDNNKYSDLVKKYMNTGSNYPTAMSTALEDLSDTKIDKPNDLLGLSYVKEIIKNNYNIDPIIIKRNNDYHGKEITGSIINASLIRDLYYENKDISAYVPQDTIKYLNKVSIDTIFDYLKLEIINNKDTLNTYLTVDEGIENRILKNIYTCNSYLELVTAIKTKRYTYNKIKRMFIHILLGIKKSDNTKEIYTRILGFNNKGRTYLNKIKKDIDIPLFIGYKPNKSNIFDIEYKSTCIYSLLIKDSSIINLEYKNKPIIK